MQCLLACEPVRHVLLKQNTSSILKQLTTDCLSPSTTPMDCTQLRSELGSPFNLSGECDPATFLEAVFLHNDNLYSTVKHFVKAYEKCPNCDTTKPPQEWEVLMHDIIVQTSAETLRLSDVYNNCEEWSQYPTTCCELCNAP